MICKKYLLCFLCIQLTTTAYLSADQELPLVPKPSDVCFSSRYPHPQNSTDQQNTLNAIKAYLASNVLWMYLQPQQPLDQQLMGQLESLSLPVQGTISTAVAMKNPLPSSNYNSYGTKLNIYQKFFALKGDNWLRGCPASPIFQELFERKVKEALTFNLNAIQIDDWNFGSFAKVRQLVPPGTTMHGPGYVVEKCYCNYCLQRFTAFLNTKSAQDLASVGITDLQNFDYRVFVLKHNYDPNRVELPIEKWYNTSAQNTLNEFWQRNYNLIQQVAGRRVAVSANNVMGIWEPITGPFDFGLAEFAEGFVDPQFIFDTIAMNQLKLQRPQVFSLKSTNIPLTRRMIALTTASGGNCLVPWDIFLNFKAQRYYGQPKDFADLFGMIRAIDMYLDGYQNLFTAGWHLQSSPEMSVNGNEQVSAFARMKLGSSLKQSPMVVHFVSSLNNTKEFEWECSLSNIASDEPFICTLIVPIPYDEEAFQTAYESKDFTPLIRKIQLTARGNKDSLKVTIPALLNPWAVLLVWQ